MARVAASISAEISRFMARNALKREGKSALLVSMRIDMMVFRRGPAHQGPLLNEATTNRRQPFAFAGIRLMRTQTAGPWRVIRKYPPRVVPTNAGTHNPGVASKKKSRPNCQNRDDTAYGSRPSPGRRGSDAQVGSLGILTKIAGAKIVGTEVGQFAFEAFDIEPQHAASGERQHRAAAGRHTRMKLHPKQFQRGFRSVQIDVARLAGQHPIESERRDQTARRDFTRYGLVPVQPVHADHQPLLGLPPDDIADAYRGILHMRRDHREIVGFEGNQPALFGHGGTLNLPADALDGGAAGGQLFLEPLKAAVEMIHKVDHCLAFRRDTGHHD